MIDDGSAFRMRTETIPSVIPEVNADDVQWHRGVVSIPKGRCRLPRRCAMWRSTDAPGGPLRRVTVATYQATSGYGFGSGRGSCARSLPTFRSGEPIPAPCVYPHQIALNVLPQVDVLGKARTAVPRRKRNTKRRAEPSRDLPFPATLRARAYHRRGRRGRSMDVAARRRSGCIREALQAQPGLAVMDDPKNTIYPMPLNTAGNDRGGVCHLRVIRPPTTASPSGASPTT